MKQLKSIFALVLMSMFVNVSYAQDSTTKSAVLKVKRSAREVTVQTKDTVETYTKTRNADVSFETKKAVVDGNAVAFNNFNKDIEGRKLSRAFVELGGGMNYIFDGSEFRPEIRATLGWETKHTLLFVNGFMSLKGHNVSSDKTENGITEGAEAEGRYNVFGATFNAGWKLWQDARYRSYVAIYGGAGYGYCKTDGDDDAIRYTSSFYGLLYQGGVKAKWGFSEHFGLTFNAEFGNSARNFHDSEQDMNNFAIKALLGLNYTF
jgi:hypothetical protein